MYFMICFSMVVIQNKYNIFIDVRQLIKKILREESDKSLSNERLQTLIGNYIDTSYPTAIKVRVAPPGGNIELTLLTLPNPEDEKDNLIFKMDAYGMPDYKINPEFFDSVRSMFGGQNKIKKVIFKWFDEKVVDNDLSTDSKKEEQNESIVSSTIKRRANKQSLEKYITDGEINYPTLCDDFEDGYDYADAVIDYAIYKLIDEFDEDIYDKDYYDDVMDYLRNFCRDEFGKYLIDIYETTCTEEGLDEQKQSESKGTNRKDLDFFDLVDKEIIFITEPFGDGKKQKSNWEGDSNIITLWNLENPEKGQEWVFDAIKYPKPEAIQWWNDKGQYTLKDEKYNQILRSIKMYDNSNKQEQNESIDDIQGIPLYHHTTESRALSIMNSDMMRGTKPDDDILDVDPTLANTKHQSMVSFTRDKNFVPNETIGASAGGLGDSNKLKVIFVADKDKLKSNYKIVPFDYSALEDRWYDKRIKDEPDTIMQPRAIRTSKSNEYEERVLTNKIEPLRRYIIDIIYKGDNPLVQEKIDEYLNNNSSKQEQNESELTERCWKGYTQKGMKTMFGKRYPNCVKAKK